MDRKESIEFKTKFSALVIIVGVSCAIWWFEFAKKPTRLKEKKQVSFLNYNEIKHLF